MSHRLIKSDFLNSLTIPILFLVISLLTNLVAEARTVRDATGFKVTVPKDPQRILALGEVDLDSCLALNVMPIGTINGRGQQSLPAYLTNVIGQPSINRIPIVGDLGRPNLELVAAQKPDLILTAPTSEGALRLLRKIAPTVVTYNNGDPWQKTFDKIAYVLGREEQAMKYKERYLKELQATKKLLAPLGKLTASIVRWNPKGPAFMYRDSFASTILIDLGFTRPKYQNIPGQQHSMPLSWDAIDKIDGDWLFVGTLRLEGESQKALQDALASPKMKTLSAVQRGNLFPVDGSKWTSIGGPLAALSIIEEIKAIAANTTSG